MKPTDLRVLCNNNEWMEFYQFSNTSLVVATFICGELVQSEALVGNAPQTVKGQHVTLSGLLTERSLLL